MQFFRVKLYVYQNNVCHMYIKVFAVHIIFNFKKTAGESPARSYFLLWWVVSSLALSLLIVPEAVVWRRAMTDEVRLWQDEADGVSADVTGDLPQSLRARTLWHLTPSWSPLQSIKAPRGLCNDSLLRRWGEGGRRRGGGQVSDGQRWMPPTSLKSRFDCHQSHLTGV